ANVTGHSDNFLYSAKVGMKLWVGIDADETVSESTAKAPSEVFFDWSTEVDALDFGAKSVFGAFDRLHSHAGGVDTTTFDILEGKDGIEFVLHAAELFLVQFDAEAVPEHIANLLADIDDS